MASKKVKLIKEPEEKQEKISEEEKNAEIEELEGLFEDEGDPQFQFAKLFYEKDKNLRMKTDLDKVQLRSIPKVEIVESFLESEYGLEEGELKIGELVELVMQEAISKKREGRKEAPKFIGKGEETKKRGLLAKLFSGSN